MIELFLFTLHPTRVPAQTRCAGVYRYCGKGIVDNRTNKGIATTKVSQFISALV